MGQSVGRMPKTWEGLLEEKDRVLHWSGEVISKVADNINLEETFQMDYDKEKIGAKVDSWLKDCQKCVNEFFAKFPAAGEVRRDQMRREIEKLRKELREKMGKEYRSAYASIKKLTKRVDELGREQRRLHAEIQELETVCSGDVKKSQRTLGQLRRKTFNNLKNGEKMVLEDKRLKTEFKKRVSDVDEKHSDYCIKRIRQLVKSAEKCLLK